ncbi:unnamed protein product [Rhizophagus irregularis]|nr:unnamed protein product [Rhizophagus irregularis]
MLSFIITRVFAQALTKYETQADYIWILQCTLKVKNNLSPHVLYTDSDPAMLAAVQIVYPQTRHLLYTRFSKVFTAGVESTQRVESINGVLKKHLDQGTLLKELVKVIENELDKEDHLAPIPLSLQQTQMKHCCQGNKDYTTKALYYINQIRSKDKCPTEGVASELIGLLTQFIMKYRHNTGLNIKEVHSISHFNDKIQESSHNYQRQPLVVMEERNILEISNPEYHKPKGLPPK